MNLIDQTLQKVIKALNVMQEKLKLKNKISEEIKQKRLEFGEKN